MYVKPCARCPKRADCANRKTIIERVRGLRLGSISFRCDIYTDSFKPGMRVTCTLLSDREQFEATATVMAWQGRKVQVCVDAEFQAPMRTVYGWCGEPDIEQPANTISRSVVKLWPDRLTPTGETVPICRNCRRPMHRPIEAWECNQYDPTEICVAGDPDEYYRDKIAAREKELEETVNAF
jgi:hypothetical protein